MRPLLALSLFVLLASAFLRRRPAAAAPGDPERPAPFAWLALALMAGLAAATAAAFVALDRHRVYDDAYMSFRYARHLAAGVGLRWNAGEAPVEGYTNLLLVVLVAPFVRMGVDPMLVSRVVGAASALFLAVLAGARTRAHAPLAVALAVGATALAATNAFTIVMLGLETVLFAALVYLGFHLAARHFASGSPRDLALCGAALFAGFLARPEALLLAGLVSAVSLVPARRAGTLRRHLLAMGLAFWAPVALYLAWKQLYFGSVLPNPAFVKAGAHGLVVASGVQSVMGFLTENWRLACAALVAAVLPVRDEAEGRSRLLAALFVAVYAAFFVRIDTLMDDHFRFMFPVAPFLVELARPGLERAHAAWLGLRRWEAAAVAVLVFAMAVPPREAAAAVLRAARGHVDYAAGVSTEGHPHGFHLQQKARALAGYPGVADLLIASVDAGVLAFNSGARHLDTVGLNDRVIARERDLARLTAYFFGRRPAIIFQRARRDGTLITYGHGPLGNTAQWAAHPGWDDYVYAGSMDDVDPQRHEMHLFLRKDAPGDLLAFLRARVVDRVHERPPIALGTRPMAVALGQDASGAGTRPPGPSASAPGGVR